MTLPLVRRGLRILSVASIVLAATATLASADTILGAVAGAINSGGPGFGSLNDTFNQAGLSAGYTSGVTDFDAFLAGNPTHTVEFSGFEWFSEAGITSASVTYDLGAVHRIDRVALWNEEGSGIGLLSLFGSADGVGFAPLALDLTPTDNPLTPSFDPYGADVFAFAPADARYIRFDMSACPQPNPADFPGCAIGEVAFAEAAAAVPEPASTALLGLGLAALAAVRRRNR